MTEQGMISPVKKIEEGGRNKKNKEKDNVSMKLFEGGRLSTFSAFRMGAYSRSALIPGWALNRINTVLKFILST